MWQGGGVGGVMKWDRSGALVFKASGVRVYMPADARDLNLLSSVLAEQIL